MPKIIENLEARLILETRRQITENGYSSVTIRSVAAGCDVGVGTVYNYFSSKEELAAACMLEDWKKCVAAIHMVSQYSESCRSVLRCIYDQLLLFADQYHKVFRDQSAKSGFANSFGNYHSLLRSQISEPLRKYCEDSFLAEFVAESMLTWTMAGQEFNEIYNIIERLF